MLRHHIRVYTLELEQPWSIASRTGRNGRGIAERSAVYLRLDSPDGTQGFGEAAPVTTYGETSLDVLRFLREFDWSQVSFENLDQSLAYLHSLPEGDFAAKSAIDLALHDGAAKLKGYSLSELLEIDFQPSSLPPTSFSIGISSPQEIVRKVREAERFPILKLKVSAQGLEESLQALRSVSPDKPLRIDGNEAWKSSEDALHALRTIERYGPIEFVEQPMPRYTPLKEAIWLKENSPLPLVADESCCGPLDLEHCSQAFDGVNVKLTKSGGIAPTFELLKKAKALGLKRQIGCMIESSLGIAAAFQLGSMADWLDLDGALLTRNDPFEGLAENWGRLSFEPTQKLRGIGVQPSLDLWTSHPPLDKPIPQRAQTPPAHACYGTSVQGVPLEVHLPQSGNCEVLLFAAIHGEEPETTTLLSKAIRSLDGISPNCAAVLCANPDGTLLGTRCNANGVELNRNFPASNWQSDPVSTKWAPDHGRVSFSTGSHAGSEPETQALIHLVESLAPQTIISLHAPLACIEDPDYSRLGYWLSKRTGLPLVGNIGYQTPGSFGSWAKEKGWHVITYELPPLSVSALHEKHLDNLIELLRSGLGAIEENRAVNE
ncbi:murein tripeptide amidase MpaA [Pelagicoccus albus]|uniref:Murein tripeptide amidase MpaA n=1 Tax=Pelagicoccus albus TaxID=415222 RepID=A0A7X1B7X7_9BACT|nr:murein tripeptide amidase MpaA [Pelagicoccus albus]MBC2607302.1 murein tripeptide amidase MpaA [Pelagicoccus albus]